MPRRAETLVTSSAGLATTHYLGAGVMYPVLANNGALYVPILAGDNDVYYVKSTDGGLTWGAPVLVFTGTAISLANWYDRWSGIATDVIHFAYIETGGHDVLYRGLDTATDSLGTQTTIFAGASAVSGSCSLSIARMRGGNILCAFDIDGGTEKGFYRSVDAGANWTARTDLTEGADFFIVAPGFAADNQDAIIIFWDRSADEMTRKVYDDSGDSSAESSSPASMADPATSANFPNFAIAVDLANSQIILVAWSANDAANADLRCWTITEAAITEVTNVVLNGTDDQGLCAIGINTVTGHWHAFYGGKSDGSETASTDWNIYGKVSTDAGTTWGAETAYSYAVATRRWLACTPRFTGQAWALMASIVPGVAGVAMTANVPASQARATMLSGF